MDIKEQITLGIFIVIMMFHGILSGCDQRVDIIEGTREDFSEKVTFKQGSEGGRAATRDILRKSTVGGQKML